MNDMEFVIAVKLCGMALFLAAIALLVIFGVLP